MFSPGDIYGYKRPDGKYGYFRLIKIFEGEQGRKVCFLQTFGDPTIDLLLEGSPELEKALSWKRAFLPVYEDKMVEIHPELIGNKEVAELELKFATLNKVEGTKEAFDDVKVFWLDIADSVSK